MKRALELVWFNFTLLVALLVGIEFFSSGFYFLRDRLAARSPVRQLVNRMPADGYPESAGQPDQSWFKPYWTEHDATCIQMDWLSYVYWRRHPCTGKYINVDSERRRRTWNQQPETSSPIRVAFFGGSTVWGTGARDEFTIPSFLSKALAQKYPNRFVVINYGEAGYVSTQEVVTLMRELQMKRAPDIAIFYDGFNEVYSALQSRAAGVPENEDNRVREFNLLLPRRNAPLFRKVLERTGTYRLSQAIRRKLPIGTPPVAPRGPDTATLAQAVIAAYSGNLDIVAALAKQFGFAAEFFWQPSVFTKTPRTAQEDTPFLFVSNKAARPLYERVASLVKDSTALAGRQDFHNLSSVLDGYGRTAFLDEIHTTELANEMIARRLFDDIQPDLAKAVLRQSR
jgi:lysophospholipase L1-like esterase